MSARVWKGVGACLRKSAQPFGVPRRPNLESKVRQRSRSRWSMSSDSRRLCSQASHLAKGYDQNAQRGGLRGDWLLVCTSCNRLDGVWFSRQHEYFHCLRRQESFGFLTHYRVTLAATGLQLLPVEHGGLSTPVPDRSQLLELPGGFSSGYARVRMCGSDHSAQLPLTISQIPSLKTDFVFFYVRQRTEKRATGWLSTVLEAPSTQDPPVTSAVSGGTRSGLHAMGREGEIPRCGVREHGRPKVSNATESRKPIGSTAVKASR